MIQPEAAVDDLIAVLSQALDDASQGDHPVDGHDRILVVKNKQVAIHAAQSLGNAGPAAKAAVPVLIRALDTEAALKKAAIQSLGQIGPAAKAALPALRNMVQESNRSVAEFSEQAIRQIDQ